MDLVYDYSLRGLLQTWSDPLLSRSDHIHLDHTLLIPPSKQTTSYLRRVPDAYRVTLSIQRKIATAFLSPIHTHFIHSFNLKQIPHHNQLLGMFSKISLTLFFIAGALAGELTISTPAALIQCQPVQVKWEGGMGVYPPRACP